MDLTLFEKHKEPVKPSSKARGPRDEVLEQIVEKVNECRKQGEFQPMSYAAIATKLAKGGITSDMYWAFHKKCLAYDGPYTKCFFGALKKHL